MRKTGILLATGSLIFLAAAFFPISQDVFGRLDDSAAMASMIEGRRTAWTLASLIFGAGGLVAAAGTWMLARRLGDETGKQAIGSVGALAGLAAALIYAWVASQRAVGEPAEVAASLGVRDWTNLAGSLLAQIALIAVGYLLVRSSPRWLGWLLLIVGGATLVGFLAAGDMPPGVYYAAWSIAGLALLLGRRTEGTATERTRS